MNYDCGYGLSIFDKFTTVEVNKTIGEITKSRSIKRVINVIKRRYAVLRNVHVGA